MGFLKPVKDELHSQSRKNEPRDSSNDVRPVRPRKAIKRDADTIAAKVSAATTPMHPRMANCSPRPDAFPMRSTTAETLPGPAIIGMAIGNTAIELAAIASSSSALVRDDIWE